MYCPGEQRNAVHALLTHVEGAAQFNTEHVYAAGQLLAAPIAALGHALW